MTNRFFRKSRIVNKYMQMDFFIVWKCFMPNIFPVSNWGPVSCIPGFLAATLNLLVYIDYNFIVVGHIYIQEKYWVIISRDAGFCRFERYKIESLQYWRFMQRWIYILLGSIGTCMAYKFWKVAAYIFTITFIKWILFHFLPKY